MTTKPKGGAAKPRQFRFTDAEMATLDALAEHYSRDPAIRVSKVDVLRIALRRLAEQELPPAGRA